MMLLCLRMQREGLELVEACCFWKYVPLAPRAGEIFSSVLCDPLKEYERGVGLRRKWRWVPIGTTKSSRVPICIAPPLKSVAPTKGSSQPWYIHELAAKRLNIWLVLALI